VLLLTLCSVGADAGPPDTIEHAVVLEAVKARAWKRWSAPLWREQRPALTASARAGVRNLRSGRKKACGAIEQKKASKPSKPSKEESACVRGGD
jgi:hypothetical protein